MKIGKILIGVAKISLLLFLTLLIVGLCYSYLVPLPVASGEHQLLISELEPCHTLPLTNEKDIMLEVTPKVSYFDESIQIRVTGLTPEKIGTLKLEVVDSKGTRWESLACFKSNQDGEITPSTQAPLSGSTYSGIQAMGLFWSLKPEKLIRFDERTDLKFIISYESIGSETLYDTIVKKSYHNLQKNNIIKEEFRNEFIGNIYFKQGKEQRPTVVLLAGSSGNFQDRKASYLAAKGYNVLDLKYFGAEHLPKKLEEVPLEYLNEAIDWLKQQPAVDTSKIALMGRSKGAEYALLYASKYDNIQALISIVGSSVVWSSKNYIKSSWSYQQQEVPYARGSLIEAIKFLKKSKGKAQNQLPYMLSAFDKRKRIKKASIAIEDVKCPVLLLSGKDDQQWPSSMMSEQLVARAYANNFNYQIEHFAYENAGHEFDATPNVPQVDFSSLTIWKSGGNFQGNALASIHSWNQVLTFLNINLGINQIDEEKMLITNNKFHEQSEI
ncbi:acyl-CoA thioesterase/bile acid-CoA:amino acid N-acyltransferase family protein [Fulvivirga lutea]|uniref:Acyl-CoA thioesterase/BAAT N-terminal domain-containing protein n=1 Tax=Fulvivirga lutea TaxID=2810512 RepID=A0A975A179_9BACT|nr:acyl-CoA thioesterase/bile acid-CoA:amino acid N-acyltransferase family protein [Fulvivirga lutea]QSE97242.1 acyl-CoA thioesterase/BAAT N-terminal domain-containing protein [Fulvivirga lutea]